MFLHTVVCSGENTCSICFNVFRGGCVHRMRLRVIFYNRLNYQKKNSFPFNTIADRENRHHADKETIFWEDSLRTHHRGHRKSHRENSHGHHRSCRKTCDKEDCREMPDARKNYTLQSKIAGDRRCWENV